MSPARPPEGAHSLSEGQGRRPKGAPVTPWPITAYTMTSALGRGIEPCDAPAVRKIVCDARADNYRFSAILNGIVNSTPMRMRQTL